MKKVIAAVLLAALLGGCAVPQMPAATAGGMAVFPPSQAGESVGDLVAVQDLFSNRDRKTAYEADGRILLEGSTAQSDSELVRVSGSTVTVTGEGVFLVSGQLEGMIIVDAPKKDKVQLVLQSVHITSDSAAIFVKQADKVFLTLEGESVLENTGSLKAVGGEEIDGVVHAKDDITINGNGAVQVLSPGGDGITAKDELTITGGSFTVESAEHGLDANDSIAIAKGDFTINAGKDGIHGENNEDASLGFVYIADGNFTIKSQGDGISAGSVLQLDGGTYNITTDEESLDSAKGIKAGTGLLIRSGSFLLDTADDGVHSNAGIWLAGGELQIASGDDGVHADTVLSLSGGNLTISESYEGLEGQEVHVLAGTVRVCATDDGINAAGGADGSGFGGPHGGDRFGGPHGGGGDGKIVISGGDIYVEAGGDSVDANGTFEMSGGSLTLCGQTHGDTAVLDYDISGTITGGTFIGTGSAKMAQSFTNASQGVIALQFAPVAAGTEIKVADASGKVLVKYAPQLEFELMLLSCPELVKGESYAVTIGTQTETYTAK